MAGFLLSIFTALLATTITIILIQIIRYNRRYTGLRLPPGPPCWPIVGNLFQVVFSGKHFIHYMQDLRKQYGPIITLRMGVKTMIVISSPELAYKALIEKSQQFASRPAESYSRRLFSSNKFTVNSSLYGPEWRSLRRNMVSGMLSTARIKELRITRSRAMDRFIEHIRSEAAASPDGQSVWVLRNARFAVFCILLEMTFGLLDLNEEHNAQIDAVMKKVLLLTGSRMDDYLPFLKPVFYRHQAKALAVRKEQVDTLMPLINRRRAILKDCSVDPNVAPFSYLDSLLDLRVEGRNKPPTDDELISLCSEFINGGTDTTATAVEWAIARIADNPSIQCRLYEEIITHVGHSRPVDEKDTENMPYLQAFVKEVLRKHPPTHFSLTHAPVHPVSKLAGYDFPPDAGLEIFLPAISEDPELWSHPSEFDPDRFLTGGETADITGSAGIRMIPFGAGRRICPGLALGTMHIALLVANMVQAFEWWNHPSQPPLDFKDKFEFTVVMKTPLLAMVKPRVWYAILARYLMYTCVMQSYYSKCNSVSHSIQCCFLTTRWP
ncbi:Cytochrome P450 [Rhynchospora pubera]|uniref:Cytochrome P450 n=1 Tax=Rhynchospora pubera TaxID=906938 RepID=A0AAV8HN92_9POAL|nr:Cytochrome P450 [Rhynchospora pubera]